MAFLIVCDISKFSCNTKQLLGIPVAARSYIIYIFIYYLFIYLLGPQHAPLH